MLTTTTFVLIWTVTGLTTGQAEQRRITVATYSHEFSSEATCNAARTQLQGSSMEFIGNYYTTTIRAMCAKK
jgi:hypothetical protein